MPTAVISDLHLGALSGSDVLRRPARAERLAAALEPADRVVLLGDTLELRERPIAALLREVRPLFERLAPALAGKRVTLVPGNHDHQLGRALARAASGSPGGRSALRTSGRFTGRGRRRGGRARLLAARAAR